MTEPLTYITNRNEFLDEYVHEEGWRLLRECMAEYASTISLKMRAYTLLTQEGVAALWFNKVLDN